MKLKPEAILTMFLGLVVFIYAALIKTVFNLGSIHKVCERGARGLLLGLQNLMGIYGWDVKAF